MVIQKGHHFTPVKGWFLHPSPMGVPKRRKSLSEMERHPAALWPIYLPKLPSLKQRAFEYLS